MSSFVDAERRVRGVLANAGKTADEVAKTTSRSFSWRVTNGQAVLARHVRRKCPDLRVQAFSNGLMVHCPGDPRGPVPILFGGGALQFVQNFKYTYWYRITHEEGLKGIYWRRMASLRCRLRPAKAQQQEALAMLVRTAETPIAST